MGGGLKFDNLALFFWHFHCLKTLSGACIDEDRGMQSMGLGEGGRVVTVSSSSYPHCVIALPGMGKDRVIQSMGLGEGVGLLLCLLHLTLIVS